MKNSLAYNKRSFKISTLKVNQEARKNNKNRQSPSRTRALRVLNKLVCKAQNIALLTIQLIGFKYKTKKTCSIIRNYCKMKD